MNLKFGGKLSRGGCFFAVMTLLALGPVVSAAGAGAAQEYGAAEANTRFAAGGLGSGMEHEPLHYLALHDLPGPSGVPLGGIGVGAVDLAPDGHFSRIALNNWATDSGVDRARSENPMWDSEAFLTLWERDASGVVTARRLERDRQTVFGMTAYAHSTYQGLFPTATLSFDDGGYPQPHSLVSIFAYSMLVPQDVKDSSLPGFWIEVTLANSDAKPVEAAVALSWPDLLGRGLYDVAPGAERTGYSGAFDVSKLVPMTAPRTEVEGLRVGTLQGLRQFSATAPVIRQATFQNYVNAVAVLADVPSGESLSVNPAWSAAQGTGAWQSFREHGSFPQNAGTRPLGSAGESSRASVVAIKATVAGGGKQTFRFFVSWSIPPMGQSTVRFGEADYGRYFQNFFPSFSALLSYQLANRSRNLEDTLAWQQSILDSTLPEWLKFKLINSAYTLYTNTILNRAGEFTVMEGGMGGLAGTMDQRLSAHPVYQKLFTQLDHAELQQFANTQDTDGGILHFDGSYFVGIADEHGHTPVPHEKMIDNTASWLVQVAKDYQQTGDNSFAMKNRKVILRGFVYMRNQIRDDSFIPVGGQTYDDFPHPDILIYTGTVYLAALRAGEILGRAR